MTEQTNAAPQQNVGLTLEDIKEALTLIDHAAEQGAYKGWQIIVKAATLRDRFANFVTAAMAHQEAADAAAKAETEANVEKPTQEASA